MRRDWSHLFPLISIILLFSGFSYGQSWSGVLAPSRAIDWGSAGLPPTFPDGETTPNPWTPPTRTQCGATLSPIGNGSDDTANIVSALSSCSAGHYVLLGSGTFTIKSTLWMTPGYNGGKQNITLLGSGPQSTKLVVVSGGNIQMGAAANGGSCTLTSGSNYSKGSTVLTCTGSTPPVGYPVAIGQCDTGTSGSGCNTGTEADNGSIWICGQQTICSNQSASGLHGPFEVQTVLVTNVSGSCSSSCKVTITPGLYMPNWTYSQSPAIRWLSTTYIAIGDGLQDMTIDQSAGYGTLAMTECYACWFAGLRVIGTGADTSSGISLNTLANSLFSNNYYYSSNPATLAHVGLGIEPSGHSATLFLNNLVQGGGINSMEQQGSNSGNVYAYNYFRDNNTGQVYAGDAEHSASPNFELREGDVYSQSEDDGTWGTHNFDSWFRNGITCYDPPYIGEAGPRGIVIDNFARFANAVGNVLGDSGKCSGYKGSSVGDELQFGGSDPLPLSTAMLWGNYSTFLGANQFNSSEVPSSLPSPNTAYSNPLPGNDNLPASFFMDSMGFYPSGGTGLSWWKVCTTWTTFPTNCSASSTPPMPPIGPDVTGGPYGSGHRYATPAQLGYQSLPIDTSYQNSYTVTASSWSSGTETLTVSGLPSSNAETMGGFQLRGANGSCVPSSGVSSTVAYRTDNEILMTGSSSTTVTYALASNPGSNACVGTMKFPDVRQFDERVYQLDSSGNTLVNPPTGLSAVVQ